MRDSGKMGARKALRDGQRPHSPLKSSVEFQAHHFNGTTYQAQECVQEEREREREREKGKPKSLKEERKRGFE
jgi:hypothetical protein